MSSTVPMRLSEELRLAAEGRITPDFARWMRIVQSMEDEIIRSRIYRLTSGTKDLDAGYVSECLRKAKGDVSRPPVEPSGAAKP